MIIPPLPSDEYRLIPGFTGYAAGRDGSIWSCLPFGPKSAVRVGEWRRRRIHTNGAGYAHVMLVKGGGMRAALVHRLILESFVGPCPDGHQTRHLNGIRSDNRIGNLAWGTRQQNQGADKRGHGTIQSGERNGQAKLTAQQVARIRELRPYHTLKKLAWMFGVSRSQIKRIVYQKSWV